MFSIYIGDVIKGNNIGDEIRHAMIESSAGEQLLDSPTKIYQQRGAKDNIGMVSVYEAHQ